MKLNEYPNLSLIELKEKISEDTIIREITFPTKQDALTYFEDISKVYNNVAVKYLKPNADFTESQMFLDLNKKLEESIDNLIKFPETLVKKVSEQKSQLKGCSSCKSSINKDLYVKNTNNDLEKLIKEIEENEITDNKEKLNLKMSLIKCPICGDTEFVITETDKSKVKTLENKIKSDEKKIQEEEMQFQLKNGQETVWIIGEQE